MIPLPLPIRGPLQPGMRGFVGGMRVFITGLKLVMPGGGVFRYALVPVLVSAFILLLLAIAAFFTAQALLVDWLASMDLAPWLSWLGGVLAFVLGLVVAYFLFGPVMKLFGPLFMDPICEQVHLRYTGKPLAGPTTVRSLMKGMVSSIPSAFRSLLAALLIELPLAIFAMVTFVGAAVAVPVTGLLQGAELMDTPLALRELKWSQRIGWVKAHLAPCTGMGAMAGLCMLVPVLNLFVVPAGVAAATILMLAGDETDAAQTHSQKPDPTG